MGIWDDWIGQTKTIENFLDPVQCQKMQATLGRNPSLTNGETLPPAWHWLYFHETVEKSDLGHDGHPRLGLSMPPFDLPPHNLTRRMWAGGKIQWHAPLFLGSLARKDSSIIAIEQKQGRTGELIFVTVEHLVHQNDQLCIREEHNIVYRSAAKVSTTAEPESAQQKSDFSQSWKLTEADLFRYSALTFNSHRIHYDVEYTKQVEGYAGLIVHGPLLVTLMLDLAVTNELTFSELNYRAKNPVTLPNGFTVHGAKSNSGNQLWVANENGALAMEGTLT